MNPILIPITDLFALRDAGIVYPKTSHAWRWLYRCRTERGLEEAFIRIGRRILVDVAKFVELTRHVKPR